MTLFRLFLLFSLVPVIEIYLLLKAARLIGALPTVAILLLISMCGALLVRAQGFTLLRRIQEELAVGRLPAAELVDGCMVLLGGLLLLTPGFFTDLIGLFFLFPISRHVIMRIAGRQLQRRLTKGAIIVDRRWH